jgi:WD40 repeat protein
MHIRRILCLSAVSLLSVGCVILIFAPRRGNTWASVDSGRPQERKTGDWRGIIFRGHTDFVHRVVISQDHKTLASGSSDKMVKLWDMATGQERATLRGHTNSVEYVAFSPDGKTLASGSWDKTVRLWDMATSQERATLRGHTNSVAYVAFSPDGKTLATVGHRETTVRLWDVTTGRGGAPLQGHTAGVICVAFSPDRTTLASGSADGTVKLWNTVTGQELATLRAHPEAWTYSVAFSPDGKTLACGNADVKEDLSEVLVWDVITRRVRQRLTIGECKDESYLYYLTFSPDGKMLAAIETYTAIHVWDMASNKATAKFEWDADLGDTPRAKLPAIFERHAELAQWFSVFFTPNQQLVALGEGPDCAVKLLELATISDVRK